MKRPLLFMLLASLTACDQQPTSAPNQGPGALARHATSPVDGSQLWQPPTDASQADGALMLDWSNANEGCQGGVGVMPDDPVCKERDALQNRLRNHGWCWGAPMQKSAADNDWHHCGSYDTDGMTNVDAGIQRGLAVLDQNRDGQQEIGTDPQSDAWYREKQRTKSPLLQAYENSVEPIDEKIGLANILAECGIRGPEWHRKMLAVLEARKRQPQIEEMWQRLSPSEIAAAKRFDQAVIKGVRAVHLGGQSKAAACRQIANMPFATNDSTFD